MGTGTYNYGDYVRATSGRPAGLLRVVLTRDIFTTDESGIVPLQLLRVRQCEPNGVEQTPPGAAIGGHLFDLYDTEVLLESRAEDTGVLAPTV